MRSLNRNRKDDQMIEKGTLLDNKIAEVELGDWEIAISKFSNSEISK